MFFLSDDLSLKDKPFSGLDIDESRCLALIYELDSPFASQPLDQRKKEALSATGISLDELYNEIASEEEEDIERKEALIDAICLISKKTRNHKWRVLCSNEKFFDECEKLFLAETDGKDKTVADVLKSKASLLPVMEEVVERIRAIRNQLFAGDETVVGVVEKFTKAFDVDDYLA